MPLRLSSGVFNPIGSHGLRRMTIAAAVAARYSPGAVAMTPYTYLGNLGAALGVTNSNDVLIFGYMRTTPITKAFNNSFANTPIWNGNAGGFTWFTNGSAANIGEGTPGVGFFVDNAGGNYGTLRLSYSDSTSVLAGPIKTFQTLKPAFFAQNPGQWIAVMVAASLSGTAGSRRFALYTALPGGPWVNQNIDVSGGDTLSGVPDVNNAAGWAMGYYKNIGGASWEQSQFYMKLGLPTYNGNSIVSAQSGGICTIDATVLSNFYTPGGPIDFGPTGSLPLGVRPEIHFVGDKTTFLTNKGSASGMTTATVYASSGTTAQTPFSNAGRGPGADTSIPDYSWVVDNTGYNIQQRSVSTSGTFQNGSTVVTGQWVAVGTTAGTSQVYKYTLGGVTGTTLPSGTGTGIADGAATCDYVGTYSNVMLVGGFVGAQVGDLMVIAVEPSNGGDGTLAGAQRTVTISGWTQQGTTVGYDDGSGYGFTAAIFTRVAQAGDNLAQWVINVAKVNASSTFPTIISWCALGYRNVNAATPTKALTQQTISGAAVTAGTPVRTAYTLGQTTTAANSIALSFLFTLNAYTSVITPQSGANIRYCTAPGGGGVGITITERTLVTAGGPVPEGFLMSVAHPAVTATLILNPL